MRLREDIWINSTPYILYRISRLVAGFQASRRDQHTLKLYISPATVTVLITSTLNWPYQIVDCNDQSQVAIRKQYRTWYQVPGTDFPQ